MIALGWPRSHSQSAGFSLAPPLEFVMNLLRLHGITAATHRHGTPGNHPMAGSVFDLNHQPTGLNHNHEAQLINHELVVG